jgi:hypothetical protein
MFFFGKHEVFKEEHPYQEPVVVFPQKTEQGPKARFGVPRKAPGGDLITDGEKGTNQFGKMAMFAAVIAPCKTPVMSVIGVMVLRFSCNPKL